MKELIVNIYLLWGTWQDIKERKISNVYLIAGTIIGFGFGTLNILLGDFSFKKRSIAWVLGLIFLMLANIWKDKIGIGDGLLILVLGNFYYIQELCLIFQAAFVLLMITSILLLCSKRVSKNYQIPFLPFLWLAHTLLWRLNYV